MFQSEEIGKLVLRVSLGILILLHGIAKLSSGVGFISGQLVASGLPSALAYGVYIGEVIAPILIIVGLFTRPAALVIAINMLFAIGLVHMNTLMALGKQGGWSLELQGMFLAAAVAVALLGAGRLSLGRANGRFN